MVFSIGVLHHLHHWREMIIQMVKCSDGRRKSKTAISYLVLNIDDFKNFMRQSFGSGGYRVESYGYYAKPTDLAKIPYEKVFMCCIKVEKNSKSPGIFIDIID